MVAALVEDLDGARGQTGLELCGQTTRGDLGMHTQLNFFVAVTLAVLAAAAAGATTPASGQAVVQAAGAAGSGSRQRQAGRRIRPRFRWRMGPPLRSIRFRTAAIRSSPGDGQAAA
jgi:hypothetical protein